MHRSPPYASSTSFLDVSTRTGELRSARDGLRAVERRYRYQTEVCPGGGDGVGPSQTAEEVPVAYYILAQYSVNDMQTYEDYPPKAIPTVLAYGGKILAVTGLGLEEANVIEGSEPQDRTTLIEFESQAAAERWYHSPEYQSVIGLRQDAGEG